MKASNLAACALATAVAALPMAAGAVTADGQPVLGKKTKAKAGQELLVTLPKPKEALPQPENIPAPSIAAKINALLLL